MWRSRTPIYIDLPDPRAMGGVTKCCPCAQGPVIVGGRLLTPPAGASIHGNKIDHTQDFCAMLSR